jgi:chromosomal replication initiator protein
MEIIDTRDVWVRCLKDIEIEVSKANFNTWFKNTAIIREEEGIVFVGVPNEFVKDWLIQKYHKLIVKSLMNIIEDIRSVEYIIMKPEMRIKQQAEEQKQQENNKAQLSRELPLVETPINLDDNLNPRYTFDTFIVGPFNELAYATTQAIVNKPGRAYNPFFVYGNTGLGKTHMIQALGNAIKVKYPEKRVHYITLEKFAMDYISSVQNNKPHVFKEKYRKYDVLIMDDIQFIGKMEKSQEELFHLFNTLYDANKQIIFSSDKHPNFIPGLEDRLKSRFSQGMIVDVIEPDYESRIAVLRSKIQEKKIPVEEGVLEYVAASIEGNIRELEGNLNTLVMQTQLRARSLTLAEVKNLIKNSVKPKKNISSKEVVKIVADFYNIEENSIYEKTRRKEIVKARQMVMYILREEFSVSYPLIGQKLGGKDHTTVIHSCEKIKNDLKNDPVLVSEVEQLRIMFK